MASIEELVGKQLAWASVEENGYELRDGEQVVGTLQVSKGNAQGKIGDDVWVFSREGFFRPRLIVHRKGEDQACATLEVGALASGKLTLDQGGTYRWTQQGLLNQRWGFIGEDGRAAVEFELESGLMTIAAKVRFKDGMVDKPETPLLLVLGWYALVLYERDVVPTGL